MQLEKLAAISMTAFFLTACGGSSSSTDSSRGSANNAAQLPQSGAASNANNQGIEPTGSDSDASFFIDPVSPDFVESNEMHFEFAVVGVWIAADCTVSVNEGIESSSKLVFVFTETELIESEYTYRSNDCTGAPFSSWYPLPVRSWQLGEYRLLADGTMSWELDTNVKQRGVYEGRVSNDIGTFGYSNISFQHGQLELDPIESGYEQNRPKNRSGNLYNKIPEQSIDDDISESVLGIWFSACSGTLESTYEFYPDVLVITDENWANPGCEGDSYAARRTTFNIQYGSEFTSLFQDKLLPITIESISNELVHFDVSQELDAPEFKVPEGKTEYRAVHINNDSLILGYCLYRNAGEDNCQDLQSRTPDMVDYNWHVRFNRKN